jgi:hypothetical protein
VHVYPFLGLFGVLLEKKTSNVHNSTKKNPIIMKMSEQHIKNILKLKMVY